MKPGSYSLNFTSFQRITGNLFFAVMIVYSIVYAVERTTYVDSAWIFFQQINGETFACAWERFPAAIPEIILFLGAKLHLSINALVYVFSISYILLNYSIWALCTRIFKSPVAGLVVILGMVMGIRELFVHTITETHQCIAYSALLYAVMQHDFQTKKAIQVVCIAAVGLVLLFSHPFAIFTASFVLLYYLVEHRNLKNPGIPIVVFLIVTVVILNIVHPPQVYGEQVYNHMSDNNTDVGFWNSHALEFITIHFTHFYWLPELAGLILVVFLLQRREWLRAGLTFSGVILYLIIAFMTFANGDSSIMMERIFLPAFFMINLALADLLFRENRIPKWIPMIVVLFFIVNGIRYINAGCLMYKKRVAYLDELVLKAIAQGNDKYILSDAAADKDKILVPWALGTETLIYSTLKYNKSVTVTLEPEGCDKTSVRLTKATCLPVTELNPHYFSLSSNEYQLLQ